METGKLIRELRIQKGMTQEDLADKTEVTARTIQRIESGEVDPRAYTLQMIAKALDVDFSLFVETEKNYELQEPDLNKWSALMHISGILPLIFPTLILWNYHKHKMENSSDHFRASITLQLCVWAISLIGLWIYWKANQPIPLIGGLLVGGLVSVINATFVFNGRPFINPFIKSGETN
jgi:transcriptional regulator with XRE-family HTH domain